jgi:hypothetical protein
MGGTDNIYKSISTFPVMINKRGISHIEAILSFVVFIGFLIFAFFFFSPLTGENVLDSSLDYGFREIDDYTSIVLESYSVVIDNAVNDNVIGIEIDTDVPNTKAKVEDSQANTLSHRLEGNIIYFNRPGNNFAFILFSEDFQDGTLLDSGVQLSEEQHSISSSESKEILSENRLLGLNESYYTDYEGLKKNFNLPNRIDFGFSVNFDNGEGNINAERTIPEGLEVLSSQDRIEIIRKNGDIVFADLIVKVW